MCGQYGGKSSDVNALRNEIFWETLKNKERVESFISSTTLSTIVKITR